MEHLFYFATLLFIMLELTSFLSFRKIRDLSDKAKLSKELLDEDDKKYLGSLVLKHFIYLVWTFVGLFSSQWILFLVLFIMGLIPKKKYYIKIVDVMTSIPLLLLILVNKYHLHIDFFAIVKGWLGY